MATACFVKCVLIQAVGNTTASTPATAAVASSSAVSGEGSFTGEQNLIFFRGIRISVDNGEILRVQQAILYILTQCIMLNFIYFRKYSGVRLELAGALLTRLIGTSVKLVD